MVPATMGSAGTIVGRSFRAAALRRHCSPSVANDRDQGVTRMSRECERARFQPRASLSKGSEVRMRARVFATRPLPGCNPPSLTNEAAIPCLARMWQPVARPSQIRSMPPAIPRVWSRSAWGAWQAGLAGLCRADLRLRFHQFTNARGTSTDLGSDHAIGIDHHCSRVPPTSRPPARCWEAPAKGRRLQLTASN
jgi:hypothetical protein